MDKQRTKDSKRADAWQLENIPIESNREPELCYQNSDHCLPPIEEEVESAISSGSTEECSETEDNYQTSLTHCETHCRVVDEIGENYKTSKKKVGFDKTGDQEEYTTSESNSEDEFTSRYGTENTSNLETRTVPEGSGDRDDGESKEPRDSSLRCILERLKSRLTRAEREIIVTRRRLGLEKFQCRQFARQYCEKYVTSLGTFRNELRAWASNLESRINGQMARLHTDEVKRINEEISRIVDARAQEMTSILQQSMKDWLGGYSISRERVGREIETESVKKIYENIQRHLESLEYRNQKSYASFRRQIDSWEENLRDRVVGLHENSLRELSQQFAACQRCKRCESGEVEPRDRISQGQDATRDESRGLARIARVLKIELQSSLREMVDREMTNVWLAFEELKRNFRLDAEYRSRLRSSGGRVVTASEAATNKESSDAFGRSHAYKDKT